MGENAFLTPQSLQIASNVNNTHSPTSPMGLPSLCAVPLLAGLELVCSWGCRAAISAAGPGGCSRSSLGRAPPAHALPQRLALPWRLPPFNFDSRGLQSGK